MAWQEREHDVTTSKRVRKRRKRQKQDNRHNKNNSLDLKYEMKGHLFFGHFHLLLLQSYHPSGNLHASVLSHAKTILQGTLEGGRRRSGQRKCWTDNIKERTSMPMPELLTRASCRKFWKRISAESSLMFTRRANGAKDWTELNRNGQGTELNWTDLKQTDKNTTVMIIIIQEIHKAPTLWLKALNNTD